MFSRPHADSHSADTQVDSLWQQLENTRPGRDQTCFNNKQVKSNRSGIPCIDHAVVTVKPGMPHTPAIAIHANEIHQTHPSANNAVATVTHRYIAAQSPDDDCTNLLVQGLDSQQGVYQFVSRKAHRYGRDSRGPTIAAMLCERWAAKEDAPLMLGERYEVTALRRLDGVDANADHVQYELVAIDRHSPTGETRSMVLTQAGLQFSGRVLQAAEIVRADALLTAHRAWSTQHPPAQSDTESSSNPLIASYAGIGRNAALITYHDLCLRIDSGSVSKQNLDATLHAVIQAGRMARGPRFLHSRDQLAALRKTLVEKLDAQAASVPTGPSMSERANRARYIRRPGESDVMSGRCDVQSAPTTPTVRHDRASFFAEHASDRPEEPRNVERPATDADMGDRGQHADSASVQPHRLAEPQVSDDCVRPDSLCSPTLAGAGTIPHPLPSTEAGDVLDDRRESESGVIPEASEVGDVQAHADSHVPTDYRLSDVCTTLNNSQIDMGKIDLQLVHHAVDGPHRLKKLASEDNGSWWRAAYLSAFLETSDTDDNVPQRIHDKVRALGADFIDEAQVLKEMAKASAKSDRGVAGIMTNMPDLGDSRRHGMFDWDMMAAIFEGSVSQLKAAGENDADLTRPSEQTLKRVARALLLKGGVDRLIVEQLFDHVAPHPGDTCHAIELMDQLGVKRAGIFTRAWKDENMADAGGKTLSPNDMALSFYEPVSDARKNEIRQLKRGPLTDHVQQALLPCSMIVLDKNGPDNLERYTPASRSLDYFSVSVPLPVVFANRMYGVVPPNVTPAR